MREEMSHPRRSKRARVRSDGMITYCFMGLHIREEEVERWWLY